MCVDRDFSLYDAFVGLAVLVLVVVVVGECDDALMDARERDGGGAGGSVSQADVLSACVVAIVVIMVVIVTAVLVTSVGLRLHVFFKGPDAFVLVLALVRIDIAVDSAVAGTDSAPPSPLLVAPIHILP